MNTKDIIQKITENFTKRLQAKTGWGKNEVLQQYKEAVSEVLLETLSS